MVHPALVAALGLVLAHTSYPCGRVSSHSLWGIMWQDHFQGKLQSSLSCLCPAPAVLQWEDCTSITPAPPSHPLRVNSINAAAQPPPLQHCRLNKYKPVLNDDYDWGSQAIQCWYGWSLLLGLMAHRFWSCFIYWQSHICSMSFQMRDNQEAVSITNIHCWEPLSQDGDTWGILENVLHYRVPPLTLSLLREHRHFCLGLQSLKSYRVQLSLPWHILLLLIC